jgi:DNA-binding response OmpR family regulator
VSLRGESEPGTNLVAVYRYRLRAKLEEKGETQVLPKAPGEGYLFGQKA